jgi:hypothetical protein
MPTYTRQETQTPLHVQMKTVCDLRSRERAPLIDAKIGSWVSMGRAGPV